MKKDFTYVSGSGDRYPATYQDTDSYEELNKVGIRDATAYCFCDDKLVIVFAQPRGRWSPPGGRLEAGETVEEATIREVKEETNMKVLKHMPIGFHTVHKPDGTVLSSRSVCIVEPYGDFVLDPDEDITEIKLIDPLDFKSYFDYGEMGEHIMKRAMELKEKMK